MLITKNLTLTMNNKTICRNLTLTLKPGEIWGILGPNGCGKTTLLQTLAGILPYDKGQILLQGQELKKLKQKHIARTIGIALQEYTPFFPQTVREYCLAARFPHQTYFQAASLSDQGIVSAALVETDLFDLQHALITDLSGGEKKRLMLGALLAQTPAIYLLDEPINSLDLRYQHRLLRSFSARAKKNFGIVLMVLHDVNLALRFCDSILLHFKDGSLLQGTHKEMLKRELLSALYQVPFRKLTQGTQSFWYSD